MSEQRPDYNALAVRYVNNAKYNPDDMALQFATAGAAAIDLRLAECIRLKPGEQAMARTGIRVAIPEGYVGLIAPRSGLGSKGLVLGNQLGVIDSDYRGEIYLCLLNRNPGGAPIRLEEGERAAQMFFIKVERPAFVRVETLDTTARGEGGFGSTGVK